MYWQYLETLKPEVFIDYADISDRLKRELGERFGAQVIAESWLKYDEPGVHNLVSVLPGSLRGRTIFEAGKASKMSVETAIGVMPRTPEADQFWVGTGGRRQVVRTAMDLLDAQLDVPSPIWTTKQQFRTHTSQVLGAPAIVYTDVRPSLNRLLAFWNVRALAAGSDIPVLWMPQDVLGEPDIAERIRALCLNKVQTVPDLLLLGPNESSLDRTAAGMGFERETGSKASTRWSSESRDLIKSPLTYWRRIDPRGFVLGDRAEGTRASIPLTVTKPETVVHVQTPVAFNPTIGGKLRLEIDDIEAIRWPRRPDTAGLVAPNSTWTQNGLSFVYAPSSSYQLKLNILDPVSVLTSCLANAGWTWSLSDKGRYASALAGAVPGRTEIRSLGDRLALRVVKELTSLTSRKAAQVLTSTLPSTVSGDEINAAVSAVVPALVPRWLTSTEISSALSAAGPAASKAGVVEVLTRLLDDRLVRRAFRFRCSNCGLATHILLDDAQDQVRCEGCTAQAILLGPSGEPELTYGLNSLLDRAADQDCHGHLIVQAWMHRQLGVLWSVPGAEITPTQGTGREIDVLAISRDEVVASEVKSATSGFTDSVAADTAQLSQSLRVDHLILAAIDDWGVNRKEHVRQIAQAWVPKVTVVGLDDLIA